MHTKEEAKYINTWQNDRVFKIQLKNNLVELNNYPEHWDMFVKFVQTIYTNFDPPKTILDVACGCGTYYELCSRHFPDLKYSGMDYADDAIETAKEHWESDSFTVKNYTQLVQEDVAQYDILHACSLHNVLSNGDEALEFFLKLQPKYMILGKLLTTNNLSGFTTYKAYNMIDTYLYYHNIDNVKKMFKEHNYKVYST